MKPEDVRKIDPTFNENLITIARSDGSRLMIKTAAVVAVESYDDRLCNGPATMIYVSDQRFLVNMPLDDVLKRVWGGGSSEKQGD